MNSHLQKKQYGQTNKTEKCKAEQNSNELTEGSTPLGSDSPFNVFESMAL